MGIQAELLLLATGLLEYPERTHARAASVMADEIKERCKDIVLQEKPKPLLKVTKRVTYYARLVKDQLAVEYPKVLPKVAALIGHDEAGAWQLLRQAAQQRMIDQRPITEMQTLCGPVEIPNSPDQDAQYALEADTMENHTRLLADVGAGAALLSQVQLWAGLFPETYKLIAGDPKVGELGAIREAMRDRKKTDLQWYPPNWMDGALRVLLQVPFDAVVNIAGPSPNSLTGENAARAGAKLKLNIKGIDSQSQAVDRPTQSKA